MSRQDKVREYVDLFDARRYWDAHEALEDHWRTDRIDFYKGMIQVAAAFVHVDTGNWRGGLKVIRRALPYLEQYPESFRGFDVAGIRARGSRLRDELVRLESGGETFDEEVRFAMADYFDG